jgi:sulfatase maturation enzyme AslB (radical SAM superfamily)
MRESGPIPTVEYRDFSLQVHSRCRGLGGVIKAQVEVTYRCNLHCAHCYTDPYNAPEFLPREMTLAEITRLLDEMAELGILYLNLTGGELFVRPDFFQIYEHARRRGFLLMLYTNGTHFTRAVIDRLQESPPFSIDVSCHSVDERAFDGFTRVPGSFRQFMRSMELLRASRLPIGFKTKVMDWNRDELPDIRRFVESFGQPFRFTTGLSPRLDGDLSPLGYRLSPDHVAVLEAPGGAAQEERCDDEGGAGHPPTDRLYRCGCATTDIHVNAWGELGTCTMQYEHRASVRQHAVRDAVAKVFAEVRGRRYTSDSPCRACAIHAFCDKTPGDARAECGDPEAPVPYDCDVALARAQRALRRTLVHPLAIRGGAGNPGDDLQHGAPGRAASAARPSGDQP